MLALLKSLFTHLFAFIFTIFFIQIPAFITAYTHRLGGHVDELDFQLKQLERLALSSHLNMDGYIQKFLLSNDQVFFNQGLFIQKMVDRKHAMVIALNEIVTSHSFLKPFFFIKNLDTDIAKECLKSFQLSIPLSFEGFIYATTGILISLCLVFMFLVAAKSLIARSSAHATDSSHISNHKKSEA